MEYKATCNTCKDDVYFYADKGKYKAGDVLKDLLCLGCGNEVNAKVVCELE